MNARQRVIAGSYLKRRDPFFSQFITMCEKVCVFVYENKWVDSEIEGALFIYKRESKEGLKLVVLNRKTPRDFEIEIKPEQEIEYHSKFLIIYSTDATKSWGIWFFSDADATHVHEHVRAFR